MGFEAAPGCVEKSMLRNWESQTTVVCSVWDALTSTNEYVERKAYEFLGSWHRVCVMQ